MTRLPNASTRAHYADSERQRQFAMGSDASLAPGDRGNENDIPDDLALIYPDQVIPEAIAGLASIYRRDFLFSAANPPYITLKCREKQNDIEQFIGNYANIIDKIKKV